jgi:hypothetical protein
MNRLFEEFSRNFCGGTRAGFGSGTVVASPSCPTAAKAPDRHHQEPGFSAKARVTDGARTRDLLLSHNPM